jgi:hypothetical protein
VTLNSAQCISCLLRGSLLYSTRFTLWPWGHGCLAKGTSYLVSVHHHLRQHPLLAVYKRTLMLLGFLSCAPPSDLTGLVPSSSFSCSFQVHISLILLALRVRKWFKFTPSLVLLLPSSFQLSRLLFRECRSLPLLATISLSSFPAANHTSSLL